MNYNINYHLLTPQTKQNFKNSLTQEGIKELEDLLEILKFGNYSGQVKTNFAIV